VEDGTDLVETKEQRLKRLFQNKKSAQKCRLKKAFEYESLRLKFTVLSEENDDLKVRLTKQNMMLIQCLEEN